MTHISLHKKLALLAVLLLSACTTSRPRVNVIAMSQASAEARTQELVVFVEVVNPTSRDLKLSRLDYSLSADSWFETDGSVALSRTVQRRSSTVVEIAVPVERAASDADKASYRLRGKLYALAGHVERSWRVDATGEIRTKRARFGFPARLDVADADE